MKDFADYLREAREEAGLNQSELAARTGLTGSYISVLENRRKPPPSDRVLVKLARALGRPRDEMLEIAHLDRTPEDIRRKIRDLNRRLGIERKLTLRLLNDLIPSSLWHFWKVRGYQEYGLERVRLDAGRKRILTKVLRRIGHLTSRDDFLEESRAVIRKLPPEEQAVLAEVLPELVEDIPRMEDDPPRDVPRLDAPPPKRGAPAAYFLEAPDDSMGPGVAKGDLLLVDPRAKPRPGDLVVVRKKKEFLLRHLVSTPSGHLLAAADPRVSAVPAVPRELAGVVLEIRRRLR